jgi:YVTN family beta-propeller protein
MSPRQVGHYRLDSLLGSGGMGEVYKAYDTYRDRYVALKLLPEAFAGDQEYLKRFERESHVAARLREPHVVPIHDFGEIDGQLFIDMRWVDGTDIGTLLDTNGRIAPQRAVHLVSQVAEALDAAHADQLVHRDIKPSNILVTASDFVYVVDFGIARSFGGRQTALTITGATIGTLHYMAPERFAGQNVDGRADIYSLACVLYECLTGTPPFSGKDLPALIYAQLYSGPPEVSSLVDGASPALDAVIARGMAKEPDDRFATAGELAAAARDALLTEAPARLTQPAPLTEAPARLTQAPPVRLTQAPVPPIEAPAPPPPMTQLPAPAWAQTSPPAWPDTPEPEPEPEPERTESPSATRTDIPVSGWHAATPLSAWESTADRPGPQAGPAGNGYRESPTQTVMAVGPGDWGGTQAPEHLPTGPGFGPGPGPNGGWQPPAEPAAGQDREPAWRRYGVILLAAAAALAVAIAVVIIATNKPKPSGVATASNTSSATSTATTATSSSATAAATSSGPSLAIPTVAGKISVGGTPSYVQVAPNGEFAYVANPGAKTVTVLNTATDLVSGTVKIPQGPAQFVSFSPDSRTAYVSVYGSGSAPLIAFIDTATATVTSTVPVDNFTPGPSTPSPDGRFLYVPNHNTAMSGTHENVVDVIDTAAKKLVNSVPVLANPHWVAFDKTGQRFYTSDHMSARVTVVNASTNKIITEIEVGETPHSEAMSPDGTRLAVTSFDGNQVFVINTATEKQIATIPVGKNPLDVTYSPDGRYLFTANNLANTVTVIEAADNRVIGAIPAGKSPTSISVLPNGRQAYVSDENDGTIEILNLPK